MSNQKLLSFCLIGRNDNYLGNFKYRLKTALNYLAWSAKKIGALDRIEVLIADWNSNLPLSENIDLTAAATTISKFVHIRPEIAQKYHLKKSQVFNAPCATNAAIRRASGRFLCFMPADVLFPPVALLNLIKIMTQDGDLSQNINKCLLQISRKVVPWQFVELEPGLQDLEDYLIQNSGKFLGNTDFFWAMPDLSCGLGAIAASQELWQLSRGFDENLTGWGFSDIEFGLRIGQIYPATELSHFGIYVYDLEQRPADTGERSKRMNPSVYHNQIRTNTDNWGLGNEKLEIQTARPPEKTITTSRKINDAPPVNTIFESFRDILQHMSNRKYYHFLKSHLPFARNFVVNWKYFYPLIWFGLTYPLLKYLEFGVSDVNAAPISALANPCVDITIIADWHADQGQTTQITPVEISAFLNDVGHKGRLRFIEGQVNTALERLKAQTNETVVYDFIFFKPDLFGEKADMLLDNVMEYLSNRGAMVIAGNARGAFSICWERMKQRYPSYTYIHCFKNEVGIILKTPPDEQAKSFPEAKMQRILKKAWHPIKARKSIYYLVKLFEVLSEDLANIYYEHFWRWPQIMFRLLYAHFRSR